MGQKRIQRTAIKSKRTPIISITGSSQVNRNYLQRVIENPTPQNLTPSVVAQLQTTHGNQFVNRLIQRSTKQDGGGVVIQRKFAPTSKKEKRVRDRAFNSRQAGIALKDAFGGRGERAVDTINSNVTRPGATWTKWKEKELKNTGFMNIKKRNRINGYTDVYSLIESGNVDDWVSLMMFSEADYTSENFKFLKAAHTFSTTANASRFHQVMDTYIYSDSSLMINIESLARNALIERAYRMMEGTIDDQANDITDDIDLDGATMTQNPLNV